MLFFTHTSPLHSEDGTWALPFLPSFQGKLIEMASSTLALAHTTASATQPGTISYKDNIQCDTWPASSLPILKHLKFPFMNKN